MKDYLFIDKYIHNSDLEILEIGPGKGSLTKMFLSNGYTNDDIVEPNDLMREQLSLLGVRKVKNYSIPQIKEVDNSYNFIILVNVFEHLNDTKEAMYFIYEVRRVLKPGGYIYT